VEVEAAASWTCPHCHRRKPIKDRRRRHVRTTFGDVVVCASVPPLYLPRWATSHRVAVVPGAAARSTPEYAYLLAKLGARMPYRRAVTLLRALHPAAPFGHLIPDFRFGRGTLSRRTGVAP
jgi:hypothetical protein